MSRKDLLSLLVAEALLDYQAATHPELGGPIDPDGHADPCIADDARPVELAPLFDQLLDKERQCEFELSSTGHHVSAPFAYRLILESDNDMHVTCRQGAVIDDDEYAGFSIELCSPLVDGLVAAGQGRPLGDQIRVFSYLVRASCQLVGVTGNLDGLTGDSVRFFRQTVRVLRDLVRTARLQQRDDTANDTAKTADDTHGQR